MKSRRLSTCLQRREDLRAGLFGRGKVLPAMFAVCMIHHPQLLAIGAGFARGPFLNAQKRQQPGHPEKQVEDSPARLRGEAEAVTPPKPPTDWEADEGRASPTEHQQLPRQLCRRGPASEIGKNHQKRWRHHRAHQSGFQRRLGNGRSQLWQVGAADNPLIAGEPDDMDGQFLVCPLALQAVRCHPEGKLARWLQEVYPKLGVSGCRWFVGRFPHRLAVWGQQMNEPLGGNGFVVPVVAIQYDFGSHAYRIVGRRGEEWLCRALLHVNQVHGGGGPEGSLTSAFLGVDERSPLPDRSWEKRSE